MKAGKIAVVSGISILIAGALIKSASKLKSFSTKFKGSAGLPGNVSLKNGNISFNLPIFITNQSSISLTLKNLYVTVQSLNGNNWEDLFIQPNGIKEVGIKANVTSKLATIPMQAPYVNAVRIINMIKGSSSSKLKVLVRFDVYGYELNPIEFFISANDMIAPFKELLKNLGLGYADNSFHYREIVKPSARILSFMPASEGLEHVIASDAIPERTVKRMANIVNKTLSQTQRLAPELRGKTLRDTCKNVYEFLYKHIQYKHDEKDREQLRQPQASFAQRETGIDCDCFSIFASSLLTNLGINHFIKVISIREDKALQHVYVIVPKDGESQTNYYTIDACLHNFDEEAKGITKEISQAMYTTELSGLNDEAQQRQLLAEPLPIEGLEGFLSAYTKASKMANANAAQNKTLRVAHKKVTNPTSTTAVGPGGKIVNNITINTNGKPCCKGGKAQAPKTWVHPQTGKKIAPKQPVKKVIRKFNAQEHTAMHNVTMEPIRQMLVNLYQQCINAPGTLAPLYNVNNLKGALANLLSVWNDAPKRNQLLSQYAAQDAIYLNHEGLAKRQLQKRQLHIGAIDLKDEPTASYPIFGLDDNIDIGISGLGGFFQSLKSMVESTEKSLKSQIGQIEGLLFSEMQDLGALGFSLKKIAKKVGGAVKTAAKATTNAVKKAAVATATAVKKVGTTVVNNFQKFNPAMIAGRTAYRGLVALNFRGWATKMRNLIDSKNEGKLKSTWTGPFIGGNWGDLVSAINAGAKKKAVLGSVDDVQIGALGEPVTIASSVAAATPIIAKLADIIDKASKVANVVKQIVPGKKEAANTEAGAPAANDENTTTQQEAPTTDPQKPGEKKSNGLLIAAAVLAGVAIVAVAANSGSKDKGLNGTETIESFEL